MNQLHLTVAAVAAGFLLTGCAGRPMPGGGGPGIQVAFPPKIQEQRCDSNAICKVKAFTRIAPNGSCEVMPEVQNVRIGAAFKPKMMWKIESIDTGHAYQYRFVFLPKAMPPLYGISIVGNDPAKDFDNPGVDAGRTTFVWDNKHLQAKTFDYALNVERRAPHAGPDADWEFCDVVDPKMFNE